MTRREILKRGAIVSGGVLWVTPVVQTLGMGSAYAAPVSGGGNRCEITIEVARCSKLVYWGRTTANFVFDAYIPTGCLCGHPIDSADKVLLAVHGGGEVIMSPYTSRPGWYINNHLFISPGFVTARCYKDYYNLSGAKAMDSESAPLYITSAMISACING